MIGDHKFLDLVARFVALSIEYKKYLISRWPDTCTDEWLDVLNTLEEEIATLETDRESDSEDPGR